jgi:hypothetical protein
MVEPMTGSKLVTTIAGVFAPSAASLPMIRVPSAIVVVPV